MHAGQILLTENAVGWLAVDLMQGDYVIDRQTNGRDSVEHLPLAIAENAF